MNTYEPTKSQTLAFLESGYCYVDVPHGHARPIDGQNALVCDRTCHVVSVVDQLYSDVVRAYLRRGLSNGTHVRVSHADRVGSDSGSNCVDKQGVSDIEQI